MIRYDQEFWMCTLPSTLKGTANVLPGCGVKINYLYYWSDTFRDPVIECQQVPVRYDPFDAGTAYAFVRRQWVQCHSECFAVFQGGSEREVMVASKELRRRHQCHSGQLKITARKLADLFQSIEADEVLLAQRLCDRETQTLRSGLAPTTTGPEMENDDQVVKESTELQPGIEAPTSYETYEEF
jgi:putative transposase